MATLVSLRALRQLPGFIDGPSEWLLHVNVFTESHSRERDRRVHVVGGGDEYGVDVFLVIEHVAIILIALGFRQLLVFQANHSGKARLSLGAIELDWRLTRSGLWIGIVEALLQVRDFGVEVVEAFVGVAPVDVAERHDVLAGEIDQIGAAHAADADASNVEHVARRSEAASEDVTGNDGHCCTSSGDVG